MGSEFYYKQEDVHQYVNEGTSYGQNNCEVLGDFVKWSCFILAFVSQCQ